MSGAMIGLTPRLSDFHSRLSNFHMAFIVKRYLSPKLKNVQMPRSKMKKMQTFLYIKKSNMCTQTAHIASHFISELFLMLLTK